MAKYIPGICNIGPKEIAARRTMGYLGIILTAIFIFLSLDQEFPKWWRIFVIFPGTFAAIGFIQAKSNFCVSYGLMGLSNISGSINKTSAVTERSSKLADLKKSIQLLAYSVIIGMVITALLTFLLP